VIPVRSAEARDAAAAAALMRSSIRRLCAADHGGDPARIAAWCANKTAANVRRWLADPHTRLLVAALDGRLAAVGGVSTDGEVLLNYVAPSARLRGVSTALLARLEAELAALGHAEGRLDSTATAHLFYRARGWTDTGPSETWNGMPAWPMRKQLAPALPSQS
jgi:GNAT superfamily N-acetyltransferase